MTDEIIEETKNTIQENLQIQLDELESLQAMFYNPGEIKIEDIEVFEEIKQFLSGTSSTVSDLPPSSSCLGYTVNLLIDENKFEMCISIPYEYPYVQPEIFIRNSNLNRGQHREINKNIGQYLADISKDEPCIFSAISWLQDNASKFVAINQNNEAILACSKSDETDDDDLLMVRFWIYSHHIYSRTKRKYLTDLANQLKISGFIMPGKPGIICVEGNSLDVNEWWQSVKSLNWKKIFCKTMENNREDDSMNMNGSNFLKFKGFTEQVFENHGPKFNHMDMGEFYKYLEAHELGYIFKDIFGVDAKCGQ